MKKDRSPSVKSVHGAPQNAEDMVNKYGTYNVQDTTDTDNDFPKIGERKKK